MVTERVRRHYLVIAVACFVVAGLLACGAPQLTAEARPQGATGPGPTADCAAVVYGADGAQHDWAWLQAVYGPGIYCIEVGDGVDHFHLEAVAVKETGDTNADIWVRRADGSPAVAQPTTYTYPDITAPDAGLPLIPTGYRARWAERGVLNKNTTDGSGHVSYQWGAQSWIRYGKGPYSLWVLSPSITSDAMINTGWLGGTEHYGPVILYFREVRVNPPTATPRPATITPLPVTPGPTVTPQPATGELAETNALLREIRDVLRALAGHLGVGGY